ncbi:hypothetical protein [Moorena producens]
MRCIGFSPCFLFPIACSEICCSLKTLGALDPLRIKFATGRTSIICTSPN